MASLSTYEYGVKTSSECHGSRTDGCRVPELSRVWERNCAGEREHLEDILQGKFLTRKVSSLLGFYSLFYCESI